MNSYLLYLPRESLTLAQGSLVLHLKEFGPHLALGQVQADLLTRMSDASLNFGVFTAAMLR